MGFLNVLFLYLSYYLFNWNLSFELIEYEKHIFQFQGDAMNFSWFTHWTHCIAFQWGNLEAR